MRLTKYAIATAPVLFVVLWSSGFIGARYGLPYIEPMTFLTVRMALVVLVFAAIALIARASWPSRIEVGFTVGGGRLASVAIGGVAVTVTEGMIDA